MSRILVTGGAGFIGSHLVDALTERGDDVLIYDNLEPQVHKTSPEYLNEDAEFVQADVRDRGALKEVLEDVEVIFHQAAAVGIGQSMYQVERYTDANTLATAGLLDILVNDDHDIKKLVVASSMSIYGEGAYWCDDCGAVYPALRPDDQLRKGRWEMTCPRCHNVAKPIPTGEDKPLRPTSIYAITKRDQEEMSLTIGKAYGIPTVALRYFNVYGPRQSLNNPYTGVCAIFSSRIKNNNSPIIFEDGLQTRDFVSVHDIVQANLLAMERSSADYETFNVGTGKATSILNIAETLSEMYGRDSKPEIVNKFRSGDIRHCIADTSKIRDMLGFSPAISFEDGMRELVRWGETQKSEDQSDQAYEELKEKGLVDR